VNWLHRLGLGAAKLSLHRQLVIWVLLPQLVLWLAGGFATYRLAVGYVNQAADATLLLATHALARQIKPIESGLLIDFPRSAQDVLEADPDDRLLYTVSTPPGKFILGNNQIPLPPQMTPRLNEPYFYDGEIREAGASAQSEPPGPKRVRIAALFLPYSEADGKQQWLLVQVARNMANRDTILHMILMDTLLPLSGLIFLMTLVFWAGIGTALAPLLRLRREVDGRSPFDLAPLRIDAAPQEVRGLVQALNELLASVQQNVSAQKRFIADAAHQLRTPLAGLKSQTDLALTATTDPELSARLKLVHQSASRGAHLINQLLMLARAEPELAHLQDRSLIDLVRFVQELVAEAVPRALRDDIDLGLAADEGGGVQGALLVRGNPLLLRESIVNVLDNAFEYAGHGSEVTVKLEDCGDHAVIAVSDNGPGIAQQDRTRVFERFVRGTQTGSGCGLGLAIVREIVSQHGGTVTLGDAHPHGLKVSISLPLQGR
jgi:two-component system sensor histidine kinase TctE